MYIYKMFSFGGSRNPNEEADVIYYNATIVNNRTEQGDSGTDPIVSFNESRDAPILKDSGNYEMSIVRFTADGVGMDLPLFIPRIQIGQPNANLTEYIVSLEAIDSAGNLYSPNPNTTGTYVPNAQQTLIFTPEDLQASVKAPTTEQDLTTRYYFVNNFQTFVDMFNTAVEGAITALDTAIGGAGLTTASPALRYDRTTQRFSLYCDIEGMGEFSNGTGSCARQATERLRLFFNSDLWGLLSHFNHQFRGGDETTNEMSYEVIPIFEGQQLDGIYDNSDPQVKITDAIVLEQDYKSVDTLWSPISNIVFTTSLLPVINEYTGVPLLLTQSNDETSGTTQNQFSPIITDISLPLSSAADYKGFLEYIPSAEYRMISLSANNAEIKNIDIRVFWKSRLTNQLYPVRLFPQSSITIKIMFRKKGTSQY